jgi:protein-S-isoprenylcysteine O-methyltransferase Ste14
MRVFKLGLLSAVAVVFGAALVFLGLRAVPRNVLGWFMVFAGLGYLLGGGVYLAFEGRRGAVRVEASDRSLWAIAPGFTAVFFGAPLEYLYLPAMLPRAGAMQAAGVALLAAAMLLRVWVRFALRGFYTGHVQVQAEHRVMQAGPYRYVRHPGYTGFMLMGLGIAVGFSSVIGLAAVALVLLPGLVYRMNAEEKLLIEQFGDEYRDYARRAKRLVPGVW